MRKDHLLDAMLPERNLPKEKVFDKNSHFKQNFFDEQLRSLQIELVKLQNHIKASETRLMILFEGIDTAGKGGTIKRITQHLNPRGLRVVALGKPSDVEKTQWYFQRYVEHLPSGGEMVLFDRSWYNRAGVERVMEFCSHEEYLRFLRQCPKFEEMIVDDRIIFFKYWLDIDKKEQKARLQSRKKNPLKRWKLSPIDMSAQKYYDRYIDARNDMFLSTHTAYAPWIIVNANDKKRARINIIRDILHQIDYANKDDENLSLQPDPEVLSVYKLN